MKNDKLVCSLSADENNLNHNISFIQLECITDNHNSVPDELIVITCTGDQKNLAVFSI